MLLLLAFIPIANAQNSKSHNTYPETPPQEKVSNEGTEQAIAALERSSLNNSYNYQFTSNRLLSEFKAEQWEIRFPPMFPIIEEIQIDPASQLVSLTLPMSHTEEELLDIVKKFGYADLEIAE